jgi:urease accessory protein
MANEMKRATSILQADHWANDEVLSTVTLSYEDRHRRRIKMTDDDGHDFLLDLAEATQLGNGDALVLEEGGVIAVRAADEDVLDIKCSTTAETARIAWHIGNRHTPVQVLAAGGLRIIYDHVLQHMVEGLGAKATRKQAAFSPEQGAYSGDGHGHDH